MNKKVIVSLLAGLALPVLAQAQSSVELYGVADAFFGVRATKAVNGTSVSNTVVDSGGMSTSHFGFRGSEALGGGLKASFNLSAFFRPDSGGGGRYNGDALFARDANASLEGDFGKLTMGRVTSPYFLSVILWNPFVDSFTFAPMVAQTYLNNYLATDTGWNNSVQYSKGFGGLSFSLIGSTGAENLASATKKQGRAYSAQAMYFSSGFSGTVAYQSYNADVATGRVQDALILGGAYDFKAAKLFAQYQHAKDKFDVGSSNYTNNTVQLGASMPIGTAGSLLISGAQTKTDVNAGTDPKRSGFALGYNHSLSKRTNAYVAAYNDKYTTGAGSAKSSVYGVGLRHSF